MNSHLQGVCRLRLFTKQIGCIAFASDGDVLLSQGQGWQLAGGGPLTIGTQQYLSYTVGGAQLSESA